MQHHILSRKEVIAAFSWQKFRSEWRAFHQSGWPSQERWYLAYLHSQGSLGQLAMGTARALAVAGRPSAVSVQSVWIDGTPQASAHTGGGHPVACELADLLFILRQHGLQGEVVARCGLLLQAKIARRFDRLPSGASTRKERRLLEHLDRSQPLVLYRDTARSAAARIGAYTLGGAAEGLRDCARYLLIPKGPGWGNAMYWAPYLVGWPPVASSPRVRPPTGLVHAIQQAAVAQTIGRAIQDRGATGCPWSRMVWDLLGDYGGVVMAGYGGQRRVNSSPVMSFLATPTLTYDRPLLSLRTGTRGGLRLLAPPPDGDRAIALDDSGPAISVIVMTVRQLGSEERRE